MTIELLQTMEWSKLCWELSCQQILELNAVLPKIGEIYPIKLESNEDYAKNGKAYLLWMPPHSELNGYYDKRPTEILKSYVLEGELKNRNAKGTEFEFEVKNRNRLIDLFETVALDKNSPLLYIWNFSDNSNCAMWHNARNLQKARVGDYWYLSGSRWETDLENIFSFQEDKICIHYSATLHHPAIYETKITKYLLNEVEHKLFKELMDKAEEIIDRSYDNLPGNLILGIEYM